MNEITKRSRELRKNMTEAERLLWNKIRYKKLGYLFLRQKPIRFYYGNYLRYFIADFFCKELKLVIELDGKIHLKQKEYDKARSFIINQLGYCVIRFKNEEILNNLEDCLRRLCLPHKMGKVPPKAGDGA